MWERGLKPELKLQQSKRYQSLPMWERGLKQK